MALTVKPVKPSVAFDVEELSPDDVLLGADVGAFAIRFGSLVVPVGLSQDSPSSLALLSPPEANRRFCPPSLCPLLWRLARVARPHHAGRTLDGFELVPGLVSER